MMKESLNIVKVGGAVVEEKASLEAFLDRFNSLGGRKLLVHGGGRSATALSGRLGIETEMVCGRRVTDGQTLEVVTMVYAGLVNKGIVSALQGRGTKALGLTGADLGCIRSVRRPPVDMTFPDGSVRKVDFGYVGDVSSVDDGAFASMLEEGTVPVVSPLTFDGEGSLLNTNADTIASALAVALSARYEVTLTYCFEKNGVMSDPLDDSSVISHMDEASFREALAGGVVSGGMVPKLENAFAALRKGVRAVVITSALSLGENGGTSLTL